MSRDHERDSLIFRGYTLEQLWEKDFEDMFHLLLWGSLPTNSQRTRLSQMLARYMDDIPPVVHQAIQTLPYVSFQERLHCSDTKVSLVEERLPRCHYYLPG
jgi:citrate synthase